MRRDGFGAARLAFFALLTLAVMLVCVCVGSVSLPLAETAKTIVRAALGRETSGMTASIVLRVRLPRVLCTALTGASLSLCGAAMQGLLRNPLADGSTLGVSSGASLGAVTAILFGVTLPGLPVGGTMAMAMLFAFLSLCLLLALALALDRTLATGTIILIGVVFSMFVSALLSLLVTFAGERLRTVTFWTMGSMASASYSSALTLSVALLACGGALFSQSRALDAFALGEERALHLGVNVRRVKLTVMIAVCALIGVCVSIGGGIGFVGLVTPHMARRLVGASHRRLLPACLFGGAVFLLLSDLAARTLLSPLELPVGVVTSLIGAVAFVAILLRGRGEAAE